MSSIPQTNDPHNPNDNCLSLVVTLDGARTELLPEQLGDVAFSEDLIRQCSNAISPPIFTIGRIHDWSDADRWRVLSVIAGIENARVQRHDIGGETTPLFEAVLSMIVSSADAQRFAIGRRSAIEAAALTCSAAAGWAANRIVDRLRQVGVRGERVASITREIEELSRAHRIAEQGESVVMARVHEYLPEAPVGDMAVVPSGWTIDAAGISRRSGLGPPVLACSTPVVIALRMINIDDGTESLKTAFVRDGVWKTIHVGRMDLSTTRTIVELADRGVPVTSNTAAHLVQYLADFEAANISVLPVVRVTGHLGWVGESTTGGFLLGSTHVRPDAGEELSEIVFSSGETDAGADQVAAGFRTSGTFQGWRDAVSGLALYPRVKFAIYAALAAPLLKLMRGHNFVVSFAGRTSTGKTTALRAAGSIYGCPDEQSSTSAVGTWDATRVATECRASVQTDLPLIVDDTKRAKYKLMVPQLIYDIGTGRGRSRGSTTGLRGTRTWHTIMLTSGEDPITSYTEDGGTRARVLEISGAPFGAEANSGQVVDRLTSGVMDHYGHAGLAWLQYIVDHSSEWPAWQRHYRALCDRLQNRAGSDPVAGRLAKHLALIRLAAILGHAAGILPWGYRDVTHELWADLMSEAPEADRAAAALRHVLSWAHSHAAEFFGREPDGNRAPHQGWAGRWDLDAFQNRWQWLGILPHKLREILSAAGFNAESVLRMWHDRGWLRADTDGRRQYRCRLDGATVRVVAIERHAIEAVEGIGGQPEAGFERMLAVIGASRDNGNGVGTHLGTG